MLAVSVCAGKFFIPTVNVAFPVRTLKLGSILLIAKKNSPFPWTSKSKSYDFIFDAIAVVEPSGLIKLVKGIRDIEVSLGNIAPRTLLDSELEKRKSLRKWK